MFANPVVSGLCVIVSIVLFIIMCYKGMHTGIAAMIAAIIAALGSTNGFYVAMFETFPAGVASLVQTMFFVFTMSGLLGYLEQAKSLSKTTELLFVHRNTVRYRIKRCMELLDNNLDDGNEIFAYILSLRIREYRTKLCGEHNEFAALRSPVPQGTETEA